MTLRRVFALLATLLTLVVVAQFFLAASGAFDAAPTDTAFEPHRVLGYGIGLFAILLTIFAALARMPGPIVRMSGLVAGLVVVQSLIRRIADAVNGSGDATTTAGKLVFGLHAVNGLIILMAAVNIARQARALSRSKAAGHPADVDDGTGASGPAAGSVQPRS